MSDAYLFFQNQIAGKAKEVYDYIPVIGSDGDLTRVKGINVIINSIRNLLLTPLGFYPWDPEYGSLLYKQLFEMADSITKKQVEYEVKTRVQKYDPRVKIINTTIQYTADKTLIVNIDIQRGELTGTVNVIFSSQHTMFGLEDEITNTWNS